jgi:Transposase IS116/IS110/IS902 family
MTTRAGAVAARTAAVNHLKALIVSAPEDLRAELRDRTSDAQIAYCTRLRDRPARDVEHRATVRALRSTAQRVQALKAEADDLEQEISQLVTQIRPQLLELPGVGPISAAQVLISWSHPGRLRSEAAFATLAGAAPIPASSGLTKPPPPQPRRRPPTQPRPAHHRADQQPHRPRHPRLHHPPTCRRQTVREPSDASRGSSPGSYSGSCNTNRPPNQTPEPLDAT